MPINPRENQLDVQVEFDKPNHRLAKLFRRVLKFLRKRKNEFVDLSEQDGTRISHPGGSIVKRFLENGSRVVILSTPKFNVKLTQKRNDIKNGPQKLFQKTNSSGNENKLASGQRRSEFIAANDLDEALEETKSDYVDNESLYDIMNKLNKQRTQVSNHAPRVATSNLDPHTNSDVPFLKTFHSPNPRKERLEKLFVRFLEDMTRKMGLNPISIAHQLESNSERRRSRIQKARLKHLRVY